MSSFVEFVYGSDNLIGKLSIEDKDLADLQWGKSNNYAQGCRKNKFFQKMLHRVIMSRILNRELNNKEFVDHINGDRSDNRRENLRLSNNSLNQANRDRPANNTSGYKGVFYDKYRDGRIKIRAGISTHKKFISLGTFKTEQEAALAYNKKAKELFGEHARLNTL